MILRIDALYLLLLIELSLVLLGTTVFLFFRGRRYSRLYRKALGELDGRGEELKKAPLPPEVPDSSLEKEEVRTYQAVPETAAFPQQEVSGDSGGDDSFPGLQGEIGTLQRVVNYQKGRILDLMCYKDLFESAQKRLSSIRQKYQELQERIDGLLASPGESREEFAAMAGVLQENNRELASYLGTLSGENTALSEKFARWEEELRKLWEEAGRIPVADAGTGAGIGAGTDAGIGGSIGGERYEEVLREKEELMDMVREFERKLEEKNGMLADMQKQYEDIEREYMVLYNQQQAAQQH